VKEESRSEDVEKQEAIYGRTGKRREGDRSEKNLEWIARGTYCVGGEARKR